MVSGYEFQTFRLQLWQASSEVAASTVVSEVLGVGCFLCTYSAWNLPAVVSSRRLIGSCPAWALKMPATVAGETSGICNLRPRPTSLEDTIYYVSLCT